jgi:hypothetical protein
VSLVLANGFALYSQKKNVFNAYPVNSSLTPPYFPYTTSKSVIRIMLRMKRDKNKNIEEIKEIHSNPTSINQ